MTLTIKNVFCSRLTLIIAVARGRKRGKERKEDISIDFDCECHCSRLIVALIVGIDCHCSRLTVALIAGIDRHYNRLTVALTVDKYVVARRPENLVVSAQYKMRIRLLVILRLTISILKNVRISRFI